MKNHSKIDYQCDKAGGLLDHILSNGAITHYDWDAAGRLTQLKNTTLTGGLVNDTGYTRDRLGNILSQTDDVQGCTNVAGAGCAGATTNALGQITGTTVFSYDPENRLKTADNPGTAFDESFSYDKVGNRKTHTLNGSTQYYNVDAGNRLKDIRSGSPTGTIFESYGYDDNGSLTSVSGNRNLTLTWDANNRVKQINSTQYRYDPKGYRIEKTGSQTTRYYLEGEHLEAVYDGNGALRDQYLRGTVIDEVVNGYHRDADNVMVNTTYHHDALQSVLGQSAHDGQIQATQSYTAFGGNLSGTGTSNTLQKYTGRELDGESGCYYYRARIYCPDMGRFISEDPLGFKAGVNFYAYVNNNPVNANDPTGNITFTMTGQLNIPGWINDIAQKIGLADLGGGKSIQFGTAESFPLFDGAERDSGILLSGGAGGDVSHPLNGGNNLYGIGSLNLSIGISPGSVKDLAGRDNEISLTFPGVSAGVSFNAQTGSYSGMSIGTGAGFSFGAQETLTGVYSMKNGFIGFDNSSSANGGFVIYPNKSNTNMMQSVYKK
ncbi:MAG: RHS repeat-associated core domain-containing protein [Methylomonas sp.]|jgi:RHS repeat-associated protein|uniref:RHS repeat-associated core domain-containing protein n=1 Tax=Methylomonas sp. TaxID=418 RepID=UPI0025FA722E|nr:RHS repeat-associated core domain-containing protein [Methylomonas sp.]MCK9609517.1 RHS repeat-associated core domain-containing protein [Methylomonas sp.]